MGIRAEVEWVDCRERFPRDGIPVAAAITGRFASDDADERDPDAGLEFWLVRPMYFTTLHFDEDERKYHDCFVDSDGVVRLPYARGGDNPQDDDELITHWAYLPTLPDTTVDYLTGEDAKTARANALGK
ncbi:AQJ64_40280 family protein [Nonomuraea longicatena]|uniref:Amine oxidase n=1 Tax=Nonomuraea longicatena TaxID=83682 RepID=A0ABN1QVQ0_9ACTN